MQALLIKPGDMLETPGHVGSHIYHVSAVYLGALNQESIVELVPLDQTRPTDGPEVKHPLVPLSMIEAGVDIGIYHHTPKEDLGG
jgi:hypothetical protein